MIEWWQALCLALIQGTTEFLPISSSAHLLLPSLLLGWPDQGLAFDVAVHLGTLLAVLIYFRRDLLELARGALRAVHQRRANDSSREVLLLAVATLPAVLAGALLSDTVEGLRTVPVLITTTIAFALVLAIADRRVRKDASDAPAGIPAALFIGVAQACALVPGTSRSGITISAGLLLGMSRRGASRFSFLMSIPVIAGAALLKTTELLAQPTAVPWLTLLFAALLAGISAYACIAAFLSLVDRVGMMPFVLYRIALGGLLAFLWWT